MVKVVVYYFYVMYHQTLATTRQEEEEERCLEKVCVEEVNVYRSFFDPRLPGHGLEKKLRTFFVRTFFSNPSALLFPTRDWLPGSRKTTPTDLKDTSLELRLSNRCEPTNKHQMMMTNVRWEHCPFCWERFRLIGVDQHHYSNYCFVEFLASIHPIVLPTLDGVEAWYGMVRAKGQLFAEEDWTNFTEDARWRTFVSCDVSVALFLERGVPGEIDEPHSLLSLRVVALVFSLPVLLMTIS